MMRERPKVGNKAWAFQDPGSQGQAKEEIIKCPRRQLSVMTLALVFWWGK